MRVLALADKRPMIDPATMARQRRVDAVLCLGDLDRAWIESLMSCRSRASASTATTIPAISCRTWRSRICTCAARRSVDGMTIAGFEGCVQYQRGGTHQYSQKKAGKLAKRLPGADVLICHCPPLGINDDPEDPAHIGFEGLREWVDRYEPRHVLHGHTHPLPGQIVHHYGDTAVHYISGAKILDLH